ncbi:MAG: ATP-binding protein, partial [Candidatus Heimdallarchaeaceae archaeon]
MNRMIFINREKEMKFLKEAKELSKKKLFTLAVWGPRRIGKTRLLLEFMDTRDLYLFVNKNKTSRSLLEEFQNTLKEKNML